MERYNKAEILRRVEDEDVEFIRLQFTDMFGMIKNIAVPSSRLVKVMENRYSIDLASLDEIAREGEEELYLKPDLDTFTILPWRPQHGKVARFLCDVCREDGSEYEASPRRVLKRAVEHAAAMGYTFQVNPECEFFLFHTDENGMPTTLTHEKAGYLDTSPIDLGENTRRDIILTLEEMGYEIDSSHHEIASAQHEIDFTFEDALAAADKVTTFKMVVRTIAKRYGLHATFMPKPLQEMNGSGMHLNMQLYKDGRNVFEGEDGNLSREGEAFLAGICEHIDGITAILNPLVNSYKRLVPGFAAPSNVDWSKKHKNTLLRVAKRKFQSMTMELRSPDAASNPYLVFALCLEAGLDGIQRELKAPKEFSKDIRGIRTLPRNLGEALDKMKKEPLAAEVLGEVYIEAYQKAKEKEWTKYQSQITKWEIENYLYLI